MFDITKAVSVEDLYWYDGPLLSIYTFEGKSYFTLWNDLTGAFPNETHVWLAAEVDDATIALYKDNKVPLREVLECSPRLFEWSEGAQPEVTREIVWADVPEDRRPTKDSFHTAM